MIELLLKGILIGVIIGLPASPNGLLCLKQNIINKNRNGYFTGLGVATADFIYAIIAGFGITIIFDFVLNERAIILLFGAIIFISIGLRDLFFPRNHKLKKLKENGNSMKEFLFGLFVTITNPFTVLAIMVAYSFVGITGLTTNPAAIILLVIGTFIGSLILWMLINMAIVSKKDKIEKYLSQKISKISGILFIVLGFLLLVKSVSAFN